MMQNQARTTNDISLHFLGHSFSAADIWPLVPCNGDETIAYNLDNLGQDHYCLTIAAPGYDLDDVEIGIDGAMLRIKGATTRIRGCGRRLHKGLHETLHYAFLMLEPLQIMRVELSEGLLTIDLRGDPIDSSIKGTPFETSSCSTAIAMAA